MNNIVGIILTLIAGGFFLIGGLISLKIKDKKKLNQFSIGLALTIIISLLIFDLAPEVYELLEDYELVSKIIIGIIFILVGIILLKMLDVLIPTHHHNHKEKKDNVKEHNSHIKHIGMLTLSGLLLHNILEGFAIFGMATNSLKIGILTSLSIALHNIPLGTTIFSTIDIKKNKKPIMALTLSSLIGGLLFIIIGNVNNIVLAIITLITMGMLIYIAIFELLPEVSHSINKKYTKIGLICGIIIMLISLFL